jgi:8-oxo-dGTP pyrophosphatase MutT (NUDIX family)
MEKHRHSPPWGSQIVRRSGLAVVIDDAGRYLVTQRTPWIPYPLAWCFPGGRGKPGEGHRDIVAREAREELGVEVHPERAVFHFLHEGWEEAWWLSRIEGSRLRHDPLEVLRCRWCSRQELGELPHFLQAEFMTAFWKTNPDLP